MITIEDRTPTVDLLNWEKINKLIEKSTNDRLQVAHASVKARMGYANLHLSILRQTENNSIKRAMFEDVVINLVSSLQAIAHVINESL